MGKNKSNSQGKKSQNRGYSPTNLPATRPTEPPHPISPSQNAPPKKEGIFAQMASTAAGVTVGSIIGHTIGQAFSGMFGMGSSEPAVEKVQQQQAVAFEPPQAIEAELKGPCGMEIKKFLECAAAEADLSVCEEFNEAFQQCKMRQSMRY